MESKVDFVSSCRTVSTAADDCYCYIIDIDKDEAPAYYLTSCTKKRQLQRQDTINLCTEGVFVSPQSWCLLDSHDYVEKCNQLSRLPD